MLQTGGDANLARKAFARHEGEQIRVQNFECDGRIVAQVARKLLLCCHTSATDFALDHVSRQQRLRESSCRRTIGEWSERLASRIG